MLKPPRARDNGALQVKLRPRWAGPFHQSFRRWDDPVAWPGTSHLRRDLADAQQGFETIPELIPPTGREEISNTSSPDDYSILAPMARELINVTPNCEMLV